MAPRATGSRLERVPPSACRRVLVAGSGYSASQKAHRPICMPSSSSSTSAVGAP
eukprot:CAMPEP_0176297364 /NCGR_PEP_ID=MMETSP0121_2-20121125/58683_1 /TAXON_ID=160619 /ORGANISM="Kryptoperidinium foliaceum, Strain CCMP 1326" /LENGTH=53 /DNA_ID=CAMNT_0017638549 /DNA_START=10 /DNA_END=168 /DNA_ORIENTATION=-